MIKCNKIVFVTLHIANILVVKTKPGEILAIRPELTDGSKSVSISKDIIQMRQVSMKS